MGKREQKTESGRVSVREALRLNGRAFALWRRRCPQLFLSTALSTLFEALTPYVGIWFSARIIDELAGGRDPETLKRLVLLTLV